ncbi:MAG TPA: tetratricopeptide repeat protein [Pyrinomonadaceae bacterium]
MNNNPRIARSAATALALVVALAALQAGCRREAKKGSDATTGETASAQQGNAAAPADVTQLNGEIERLEKQAERNPADDETQDELARTYVKRAKLEQNGGQYQEALEDYQRALRHDPDNDDAQAGAAAANQQLGGDTKEDENGAPIPPPISPNVADEEGKPTPTPKKQ